MSPRSNGSAPGSAPEAPKPATNPKSAGSSQQKVRQFLTPSGGPQLWYLLLGVWVLFLFGQVWYENTQVATIPYSKFLEYQKDGRVRDLRSAASASAAALVDPKKGELGRFSTIRVDPAIADPLAKEGVEFTGVEEDTWIVAPARVGSALRPS